MTTKNIIITLGIIIACVAGLIFSKNKQNQIIELSNKANQQILTNWPGENILLEMDAIKSRLSDNFFPSPQKDGTYWLSVSKGPYSGQFYSRDTFVTARGGIYMGNPYIEYFKQAVRWFSNNMKDTGYIPLWFRQTDDLNSYEFCPYNRNLDNGGIRQVDHILQYIDAMWLTYSWSGDSSYLKEQIPFARKAWNYLETKTSNYLIDQPISQYAGLDWADKILRGGVSSYVQAYWYHSTISLAYMEKSVGNNKSFDELIKYANNIKQNINQKLWLISKPKGSAQNVGHYLAWKDTNRNGDYFEVDSNLFMVAEKITDQRKADSIMNFYIDNQSEFENNTGATRVLLGSYDKQDFFDNLKSGEYQNGGYWYMVSYPAAKALARNNNSGELLINLDNTLNTFISTNSGLAEWYHADGKIGGAPNYSWSLAYPYYLLYNAILGIETTPEGLVIAPTLPDSIKNISIQLKYRGKDLNIKMNLEKSKYIFLSNLELINNKDPFINLSNY